VRRDRDDTEARLFISNGENFVAGEQRLLALANADSAEMALAAARAGLGFALLPALLCEGAIREKALNRVKLDREPAPLDVFVAFPSREFIPVRVRRLVEHLESHLARLP
jgi:DNA-binding transcriptional LysR family regulator